MNTQAWPGGRCCEGRPVELRVACQGNYREARSIALMPGFEATLSYSVQVLPKHSHLRCCERTKCNSVHNILKLSVSHHNHMRCCERMKCKSDHNILTQCHNVVICAVVNERNATRFTTFLNSQCHNVVICAVVTGRNATRFTTF